MKVDGKIISNAEVSSKTTTDEWLTHEVDLTPYAGKTVDLQLESNPTIWMNEWGYWNEVKVIISPLGLKKTDTIKQGQGSIHLEPSCVGG